MQSSVGMPWLNPEPVGEIDFDDEQPPSRPAAKPIAFPQSQRLQTSSATEAPPDTAAWSQTIDFSGGAVEDLGTEEEVESWLDPANRRYSSPVGYSGQTMSPNGGNNMPGVTVPVSAIAEVGGGMYKILRKAGGAVSTATGMSSKGVKAVEGGATQYYGRRRRRRRRLLTASDKADIAYLTGVLGKGQLGQAAVTALLSRRV